MRYFLLQNVDITIEQEKRFLAQVLEQEKEDTEFFKQGEKVITHFAFTVSHF